ncbi:hypothetical protein Bbelb_197150 [Branchiostoma belcheri]|nr:hypothetical protein Bbelb_197150 [Branchiostoma belcheri]
MSIVPQSRTLLVRNQIYVYLRTLTPMAASVKTLGGMPHMGFGPTTAWARLIPGTDLIPDVTPHVYKSYHLHQASEARKGQERRDATCNACGGGISCRERRSNDVLPPCDIMGAMTASYPPARTCFNRASGHGNKEVKALLKLPPPASCSFPPHNHKLPKCAANISSSQTTAGVSELPVVVTNSPGVTQMPRHARQKEKQSPFPSATFSPFWDVLSGLTRHEESEEEEKSKV